MPLTRRPALHPKEEAEAASVGFWALLPPGIPLAVPDG
jgi:hypothetical protein